MVAVVPINCTHQRKNLSTGLDYKKLKDNYVIFICTFDPFGDNLPIYTFENRCAQNLNKALQDGTQKIFLNTTAKVPVLENELKAFYTYISKGQASSHFTAQLESKIATLKENHREAKHYMTLTTRMMEQKQEGIDIGRAEG